MSELVAIWVAGAALLALSFGVLLAVRRLGWVPAVHASDVTDLLKVLAVVVVFSCVALSLLTLVG